MTLDADRLIADAREQTGLDDLGHPSAEEGLRRYVDAANDEAQLSELGELAVGGGLVAALANRLRVLDFAASHPEVAEEEVAAPIVVIGMFRAGTTLLSNLLDRDPANRSLLLWEASDSVPPPQPHERRRGPRVDAAQAGADMLEALNPAVRAIHHEDADSPTECIAVMGQAFQSISWEAIANVPSYGAWWRAADARPAYDYHRTVLQVLSSGGTHGRWTLKSPHHALALDALVDTYPDARLVLLHRDPTVLAASVCSLISTMSGTFSDADHGDVIRRHWTDTLEESIRRIDDFRARRPEHVVHDVQYSDLLADPVATVRGLYDDLGAEPGDGAFEAMSDLVAARPRGSMGVHRYDLAGLGLDEGALRERFASYSERYDVEVERPVVPPETDPALPHR